MFDKLDDKDIDIILAPYADNSLVIRADHDLSDLIVQILKSSFNSEEIEFYNLQTDVEKDFKSLLGKILDNGKIGNDVKSLYYSNELFSATKYIIWILLYNFIQQYHETDEISQMKSKVYDNLALKYYQFRLILLDDRRKSANQFSYNWSLVSVLLFLNFVMIEFPESMFYQNLTFIFRAEEVTQNLLFGFTPENTVFHQDVSKFLPKTDFYRFPHLHSYSAHQQNLAGIIKNDFHHQNIRTNRNQILFSSKDSNPLITRALELRSFRNTEIEPKISTRNIKCQPKTVNKDFVLDAKLSKERSADVRKNHIRNINANLRQICSKEADMMLAIEKNAITCQRVLKNKQQSKEMIDFIEKKQHMRTKGIKLKRNSDDES